MDRFQAMKVFVAVATHSSFAGAARALQLTPPVVTRTVGALENHLGVQLLIRTTRQVRLTEAGAQYLRDSERILAALDDAEAAASDAHGEARGLVTVTAPALFGRLLVMPIILDFLDDHSRVDANTIFVDRVVDLVDEGVDIAIRIGHLPDSSLMASKVGTVRRMVCASPSYLEREGAPASPDDLRNHRLLVCPASGNGPTTQWRFGTEDAVRVAIHPRVHTTSNDSAVAAAVNGWGVTRVLSYQIGPQLSSGELQPILTDCEPDPIPVHVMHAQGGQAPTKVRLLVDVLVARLRAAL